MDDYKRSISSDSSKRLVPLSYYISPLLTDWRYASVNNFTHIVLYSKPVAFARLPAAIALQQVQQDLLKQGLSLKFYDAYRPFAVTKKMWKVVPDERYAANPAKGSGHNRGAAFDVSLVDLETNQELDMPTAFDNFTDSAHHNFMTLPDNVIKNRKLLRNVMEKHGFVALETEWWHYTLPDAASRFELLNLSFDTLSKLSH